MSVVHLLLDYSDASYQYWLQHS